MHEVSDAAMDTLIERFAAVPSPHTMVLIVKLGGAVSRVGKEETAFYYRDAAYHFEILSAWDDPNDTEKNIGWTRECWNAMQPFASSGIYINQMVDEGEQAVEVAYGSTAYQRLVALKDTYDPMNLFQHNQNIKPTV